MFLYLIWSCNFDH